MGNVVDVDKRQKSIFARSIIKQNEIELIIGLWWCISVNGCGRFKIVMNLCSRRAWQSIKHNAALKLGKIIRKILKIV